MHRYSTALILFLLVQLGLCLGCAEARREGRHVPGPQAETLEDEAPQAGRRGLPISASAPSFMPMHLTGSHAGRQACPLCLHGNRCQLQLWVQEQALEQGLTLARAAEADYDLDTQIYLVLVPQTGTSLAEATLARLANAQLGDAFAVSVPAWDDPETGGLYGHALEDRPDLRAYVVVNRRVFARFDNPASEAPLVEALCQAKPFRLDPALTDAVIAPAWEPGTPLVLSFRVVEQDGRPVAGLKVSAWQTDSSGLYNPRSFGHRIPRLQAVAWTDQQGQIDFTSIFPAPYPNDIEPAHIHYAFDTEVRQWCALWFEGDPLLTPDKRALAERDQETVIVPLDRSKQPWSAAHVYKLQR